MTTRQSISTRLQQFALAQLDRAIHHLTEAKGDPDTAIHETRRCVKRVRALLRLVKAELPATTYDRDNLSLRNIGRQLSALRDAAVIEETFAGLRKEAAAQLPRRLWRELKQTLATHARSSDLQKEKRMNAVAARLRVARTRVEKWSLDVDDPTVLQQGLRKAYRRGRRAMEQALKDPTAETFHEWRKQVNHLRHQLQLLQTLQLGKVKPTLPAFKTLAQLLGWKNDLAILAQQLAHTKANASLPPPLEELLRGRDVALTEEAIRVGKQLYHRKPKAFLRSIW